MRAAIIERDEGEIERLTAEQVRLCDALRVLTATRGAPASPALRDLAREVRAENEANEALLREGIETIDRLVRALARPPEAGTYGLPGRRPTAAPMAFLNRTA